MAIKSSDNKVLHERVEAANAVWLWYITCLPILFVFSLINLFLLWSSILRNVKLWCIHLHIAFLFFVLIWKFSSSVAFDEDFEAELAENHDARNEVSLLAKSPDPELTEVSYIIYKFYVVLYYLMVTWSASIIGVNNWSHGPKTDFRHQLYSCKWHQYYTYLWEKTNIFSHDGSPIIIQF